MLRKLYQFKVKAPNRLLISFNGEEKEIYTPELPKNPPASTVRRIIRSCPSLKDYTNLIISIYLQLFSTERRLEYFEIDYANNANNANNIFFDCKLHLICVKRELLNNKTIKCIF